MCALKDILGIILLLWFISVIKNTKVKNEDVRVFYPKCVHPIFHIT